MGFSLKETIALGWPILSILFIFSIVSLAIFLQCWKLIKHIRCIVRGEAAEGELDHITDYMDLTEKRLALLGTIANSAPFVGLLGTVIGIIRTFHTISMSTGGGISKVAGGISEALFATAAGLAVAIPASMAYNFYSYHIQKLAKQAGIDL